MKINDIVKDEIIMIQEAVMDYGEYYQHAKETIEYLDSFLENKCENEAFIFLMFFTQVKKSLKLSLLSFIRRHNNQAGMSVRHALESFVLAVYGLKNTNLQDYYKKNGTLPEIETVNKKSREWFDSNYPEDSGKIKVIKKELSNVLVHANLRQVFNNFSIYKGPAGEGFATSFFDEIDIKETKESLRWLANISISIMVIIKKIADNNGSISVSEGFSTNIEKLALTNKILTERL